MDMEINIYHFYSSPGIPFFGCLEYPDKSPKYSVMSGSTALELNLKLRCISYQWKNIFSKSKIAIQFLYFSSESWICFIKNTCKFDQLYKHLHAKAASLISFPYHKKILKKKKIASMSNTKKTIMLGLLTDVKRWVKKSDPGHGKRRLGKGKI